MVSNDNNAESGVVIESPAQGARVVVRFRREAGIRHTGAEFASVARADVSSLNQCMTRHPDATAEKIFTQTDETLVLEVASLASSSDSELPPLDGYFNITSVDSTQAESIRAELESNSSVAEVYIEPPAVPAIFVEPVEILTVEAPPTSTDFSPAQGYLNSAPEGVDARFAWTQDGGTGDRVQVIDIEGGWNFNHEDLLQNQGGVVGGVATTNSQWENHGTAVQGEIAGDENAFGVMGIAPQAKFSAVSIFGEGNTSAKAIKSAADKLKAGDIILIELHRSGPNGTGAGQFGFIPIEYWSADFAAVKYATAKGIIVVGAAGNGSQDLDDPVYEGKFDRNIRDSGAILVGAGAPPSGNHGPDRSRLSFSNYGAIVDAQGWGREVTTTGYGDLQGGSDKNKMYTSVFSGTSSASPIVVGVVACLQSIILSRGSASLNFSHVRDVLRKTGSPQTDASTRPTTERIGNRPDIKQAVAYLSGSVQPVPPRPQIYANGKVFVNDKPAPDDLVLFARIDDYDTEHQPKLQGGGYDFLKITPGDQKYIGRTIKFFLRTDDGTELLASETDVFNEGPTRFGFDLHATQVIDGGGDGGEGDGGTLIRSLDAEALDAAARVVAGMASTARNRRELSTEQLSTMTQQLFKDYRKMLNEATEEGATLERNKAIVTRYYEECINGGNLNVADEIFAPDYVSHNPEGNVRFPYSPKFATSALLAAFPDLVVVVEDLVVDGENVMSRVTFSGVHKGEYRDLPATGRQVTWTGFAQHRIAGGKIVETWQLTDTAGTLRQINASATETGH